MPVTVELKYEYYMTWPGRVKIVELGSLSNLWSILWILKAISILKVLALLCMMCAAPAFNSTQHWFLLVVVCGFLGSLFFSLYHLCLDTYLKNVNVGWLPAVSHAKLMHLWDRKQFFDNFSGILVHCSHFFPLLHGVHCSIGRIQWPNVGGLSVLGWCSSFRRCKY